MNRQDGISKAICLLLAVFLGSALGVGIGLYKMTHHSVWTVAAPLAVTHGVAKVVSTTAGAH